jgi:hypothetical protein
LLKQGGIFMPKNYFLTAVFQNKFGKAPKYFDEKGWHWMLNFDKPIMYETYEEAEADAEIHSKELASSVIIKETEVYLKVYEHRMKQEEAESILKDIPAEEILFVINEGKNTIFLSHKQYFKDTKLIVGLYKIDKLNDIWIYCKDEVKSDNKDSFSPEQYIYLSYRKLEEAKALMQILGHENQEINQINGIMVFVEKLIKGKNIDANDHKIGEDPKELAKLSLEYLQLAKEKMKVKNYPQPEIARLDGVMVFVSRVVK